MKQIRRGGGILAITGGASQGLATFLDLHVQDEKQRLVQHTKDENQPLENSDSPAALLPSVSPLCLLLCRKKGYPAITDANLVLGRILPEFFPSIFGEDEAQPLDAEGAKEALHQIAEQVNEQARSSGQPEKSVDEVLLCPRRQCKYKS